jgi:Flp pilus assembly protein TadB
LNQTIKEKEQILAGNKTLLVPYNTWYQQTLDSFRNESKREGGLDWAINGTWYLSFAPMAYWVWWWVIPLEIVLVIIAIVAFVWAFD